MPEIIHAPAKGGRSFTADAGRRGEAGSTRGVVCFYVRVSEPCVEAASGKKGMSEQVGQWATEAGGGFF